MKTQAILIGALVGAVVALGTLLVLTNLPSTAAQAQGGGGGGGAGNVVAIATDFLEGQSLLYVIDSQAQVILAYGFYRTATGDAVGAIRRSTMFDLVGGRSYKYDAQYVDRAGYYGNTTKDTTPDAVRKKLQELTHSP